MSAAGSMDFMNKPPLLEDENLSIRVHNSWRDVQNFSERSTAVQSFGSFAGEPPFGTAGTALGSLPFGHFDTGY